MKVIARLFKRELDLFFSNSVAVFIFFAAPIGYALIVGSAYKEAKLTDLNILVVDSDNSPLSNKLIDTLDDNQYLQVAEVVYLDNGAEQKLIDNDYVAVVYLPDRFEADIFQKRQPEIRVELNGSNMVLGNYASSGIQTVLGMVNAGLEIESLKKQGFPESTAYQQYSALTVSVSRFYNPANNYLFFVWPGIMGTVMQQVILIVMALSFSREFEERTFTKLVRLSDSPAFLLFIKSFPVFIMSLLMWALIYYGFYPFFKVALPADMWSNWILIVFFTLANIFLGTLASILIPSQLKTTEVLMAISLPSFILSGFTWPLEGMPNWLVSWISDVIPLTHFLKGYRKLELMDVGLSSISGEFLILVLMSVILSIVSYAALKRRIHNHEKRLD